MFSICAKHHLLDVIICLISKNFLKWHVTQLVNPCWLNNMTIFPVINSNGSVNSFYGLEISKPWRFWYFHCKYERIPSDRVSCIFKNFVACDRRKLIFHEQIYFIQVLEYSNYDIWKLHISPWHEESKSFLISLQLIHVRDVEVTRYFWEWTIGHSCIHSVK